MAITLRTVTGSALSFLQVDENFSSYYYSASVAGTTLTLFRTGSAGVIPPSSTTITIPSTSKWIDSGGGIQRTGLVRVFGPFAQGNGTTAATGLNSHAEGNDTVASATGSHAEGLGTVASGSYQHVQGQYNISSSAQSAFIIGNGTANGSRSNLVFASGSTVDITGSLNVGSANVDGRIAVYANIPEVLIARLNGDSSLRLNAGSTITPSASIDHVGGAGRFFEINSNQSIKLSTGREERITIQNNGGIIINSGGLADSNAVFQVNEQSEFTGSLRGFVSATTIASTTASIDFSTGNFFTVQLVSGSTTHISASNIRPGQTTSIRVTQPNPAGGTATFSGAFKQPDGYPYIPTTTALGVDVLTVVSFDSANAYMVSVNKLA